MLWFVFAVFTGAAVLSVVWPLARTPRGLARGEIDVAFYKAQLAEIDRDAARRLVAPADAKARRPKPRAACSAADAAIEPPPAASRTRARIAP